MSKNKNAIKHKNNTKQLFKVIKAKDDELYFGTYLIKVSYKTILDILETFYGGFLNIPDPNLNSCYLQCLKQVGIILSSQKKIYDAIGEPPKLFESLVGDIEEADQEWELGYRQTAREYYGKIENLFVKHGSKNYKLPKFIQDFFDFAKEAIKQHKKTEKIYRNLFGMTPKREKVIKFGNLAIDVIKSTLQYKNKTPITISLTTEEIIFLVILMKNNGRVVTYKEILKVTGAKSSDSELPSRMCHSIKRNLRKHLLIAGMSEEEIARAIVAVRNIGYKIVSD